MASNIGSSVGDLLFYSNDVTVYEKLIQMWTHSKYTHVAIAIDDDYKIEAIDSGIIRSPINNVPASYVWHLPLSKHIQLNKGLEWLSSMRGKKYGWSDAFTAANPFKQYVYLVRPDYYDCSALAAQFLIECGLAFMLGQTGEDPHQFTPGSLLTQLESY